MVLAEKDQGPTMIPPPPSLPILAVQYRRTDGWMSSRFYDRKSVSSFLTPRVPHRTLLVKLGWRLGLSSRAKECTAWLPVQPRRDALQYHLECIRY